MCFKVFSSGPKAETVCNNGAVMGIEPRNQLEGWGLPLSYTRLDLTDIWQLLDKPILHRQYCTEKPFVNPLGEKHTARKS